MKTKTLLFPMVALLLVFSVGTVLAEGIVAGEAIVQLDGIAINHVHNLSIAAFSGETIPVKVLFTASENATNVKVKVDISSGHEEYTTSYLLGDTINDNRVYRTGVMALKIPARLSELTEEVYVTVAVTASNFEPYYKSYVVKIQRNSYDLRVLSVDYDYEAEAGSTVPVMVVVKNRGYNDGDDVFLTVSVPELGISAKAYLDDLAAIKNCDEGCNNKDSVSKILNLKIPSNAEKGTYDLVVTVYNEDTKTVERGTLKIVSSTSSSSLIATSRNQEIRAGETKKYELTIVNAEDKVRIYTLSASSPSALDVSVKPIVTVSPQSVEKVEVTVKARNNAEEGSYAFNVFVNGESTSFIAEVTKNSNISSSSVGVAVLTIILAIIFVALLVLLIVLLFRREKREKVEEVETSYY